MTQIKLRRDTFANFTSKNPILGVGEPAYETDTKKLKIGDGTTAYTQLEYFTADGGGSTDITATLPLKIVDGVISLEVDGQTIQIVDGKLHANLDELGNEVNTLTGEVTDLSGRVTAAEADILKKEDKLTPVAPITINKYVKSNLHGFSFTTNGTGVYAPEGYYLSYRAFDYVGDRYGYAIFSGNAIDTSTSEWKCYIDIPYQIGQVARCPIAGRNEYSKPMCILGKTAQDGTFHVITTGNNISTKVNYVSIDSPLTVGPDYIGTWNKATVSAKKTQTSNVWSGDLYSGLFQVYEDETGAFSIQYHRCNGASNDNPRWSTAKNVVEDTAAIARLKEINTIRIVPAGRGIQTGQTSADAISVNSIGLYNCSTDLFSLNNDMSQFDTGNLFDISGETAHNYLELSIGSGLAITDGKLTASSTAPANMVTTDTSQDITGEKSFTTGQITFKNTDSNRKILGEINSNGFYCNYYTNKASGEKPCYLGKISQTAFNLGIPDATETEGRIYATTLEKWQSTRYIGTILDSSNLGSYVDGTTITYTNNKLSAAGGSSAPPAQVLKQLDLNYVGTAGTYFYSGWSGSPPTHTPISGINDSFFLEIISNNGKGPENRTLQRLTYNHESSHKGASYFRTGMEGYDSSWTSWVQITPAITS